MFIFRERMCNTKKLPTEYKLHECGTKEYKLNVKSIALTRVTLTIYFRDTPAEVDETKYKHDVVVSWTRDTNQKEYALFEQLESEVSSLVGKKIKPLVSNNDFKVDDTLIMGHGTIEARAHIDGVKDAICTGCQVKVLFPCISIYPNGSVGINAVLSEEKIAPFR